MRRPDPPLQAPQTKAPVPSMSLTEAGLIVALIAVVIGYAWFLVTMPDPVDEMHDHLCLAGIQRPNGCPEWTRPQPVLLPEGLTITAAAPTEPGGAP